MNLDLIKELLEKHAGDKEYKLLNSFEAAARKFYREQFRNQNPTAEEIQLVVDLLHGTTCGCEFLKHKKISCHGELKEVSLYHKDYGHK